MHGTRQRHVRREIKDEACELASYDAIGMEYFYLGDIVRASYYHERMVRAQSEPSTSDIRQHRHNFVFGAPVKAQASAYANASEIYMRELAKNYEAKLSGHSDAAAEVLSRTTQRFFAQQRTALRTACIDLGFAKKRDSMTPYGASPEEIDMGQAIISTPADLSFDDLPSPYSHSEIYTFKEFTETEEQPEGRKQQRSASVLHCPAIVAYIHRKHNVNLFFMLYHW